METIKKYLQYLGEFIVLVLDGLADALTGDGFDFDGD